MPEVLLRLHELDHSLPLGFICDKREVVDLWRELPIQVFIPKHTLLSLPLISKVHARRLQVFTWTVNLRPHMLRLTVMGVDGLISDNPALLVHTIGARDYNLTKSE